MSPTTIETANALHITRTFNATPDRLFDAWTQPEAIRDWFGCPESRIGDATVDLRPGGKLRVEMILKDCTCQIVGTYRQVDRPYKLVFTWNWVGHPGMADCGETLVTVELEDAGEGRTEMRFSHEGFPTREFSDMHNYGWNGGFEQLAAYLQK